MPAYNVEKYIKQAVDSLLHQTIDFDELIIVDDGSTDSTLDLINSLSFSIPTKIISQKNSGQGIARNIGLQQTESDYCYFFDSDDVLELTACEVIKKSLLGYNFPDILLFEGKSFVDLEIQTSNFKPNYTRPFYGYYDDQDDFFEAINNSCNISCSPCLYVSKREVWQSNRIRFNRYFHEDEEVFYRLLISCNNFLIIRDSLFNRRVRFGSTMTMVKTIKHVRGQVCNLKTTFELKNNHKYNKVFVRALNHRIYLFAGSYYASCLSANVKVDWCLIFKCIVESRNYILVARLLYVKTRHLKQAIAIR